MPFVKNGYEPATGNLERAGHPNVRQLLVQRYRLLYQVTPDEVHVRAFLHGARDLTRWRVEG